jgi:uncharacterized membrane protein
MEIELKNLIIRVLKESRSNLSPFEIFNYLISKNLIPRSIRGDLEIGNIRRICRDLVFDGILIEKGSEKYAFNFETEITETLIEPKPKTARPGKQAIYHSKKNLNKKIPVIHQLDIIISVILVILSIIFILIPPFNETFIRILVALPLLLILPGYFFILFMFPKQGELSAIERFTFSIGLSIAINVFDGFVLNYTQWGYRPNSIVISLSIIIGIFLIAGYLRRWRLGENAYYFSTKDIISFYLTLNRKDTDAVTDHDPALEKMLIKTMVIAILLASAMMLYVKVTTEPEKFTAFYILGSNGKAEDFPDEVDINKLNELMIGIENYEYEPVNYTMRIQLDGQIFTEQQVYLEHKDKFLKNVTYIPRMISSIAMAGLSMDTKSKLEFILLKDGRQYRSVHLWIKPVFDITEFTFPFSLVNGDMEQTSGWNFKGTSQNISGNYTNETWVSASHSYVINFTANAPEESGDLYQNITITNETLAIVSFYVKDSYLNISDNISKQVLLDDSILWKSGVGKKSWEQIKVPVFIKKNSTLSFRIYNKIPVNENVQVWWDKIIIEPYGSASKIIINRNDYLQPNNFKIRGLPIAMKGNARIDGANFPGFYYNIDKNISYETLDINFSDNSTIEQGNATYISTFDGNEISLAGSKYKLIAENQLSKMILKNAGKTMKLKERWFFDYRYSLDLDMISSSGDTAILSLRNEGTWIAGQWVRPGGILEYKTKVAGNTFTIITIKVNSIAQDSADLTVIELYSDTPTTLKEGDSFGDFMVTNINSTEIVMNNSNPIEIRDGALIFDNSIRFDVINDLAIPYASSGEVRGSPQTILTGSLVNINGYNYPGFHYDFENEQSIEELSLFFGDNNIVETGNAIYKTTRTGDTLYFLGRSFWLPNPERVNLISRFSTIRETIPMNGTIMLEGGYTLNVREGPEDGVQIFIKKESKTVKKEIDKMIDPRFYHDLLYEMFTTTFKRGYIKSNVIYEVGDEFEYRIEYSDDEIFKLFSGEIKALDSHNVTLEIWQYQIPIELMPARVFGEFEIEYIAQGSIVLKNTKPLKFDPGKETPILGGTLKIRTSAIEPIGYPLAGDAD